MQRLGLAASAALVLGLAPAIAQADTVAIVGGTVYPVSGPRIPGGTVVISDGKITAVGAHVPVPKGARTIDARGKIVTPGFIDAATQLGIVEVGGERSTNNASAHGPIAAAFQPWYGFFSESAYIQSTRDEGVTTVGIVPAGGLIGGQVGMLDLDNGTAADMFRRGPVAITAGLRGNRYDGFDDETAGAPNTAGNEIDNAPNSRGEAFGRLHALFEDVRYYAAHRATYNSGASRTLATSRDDLEALVPVVQGKLPILLDVDRVDDIDWALRFAKAEGIRLIIGGGAEAWKIAPRIAAAHVAVLSGAMNNLPESFDTLHQRHENLAILRKAGVEVVIIGNEGGGGDEESFNARNIRYEGGNAVASGLSHDDALRALTLAPADVFGMADKIGSLAPGKDANIVVWSGDPFEFTTKAEHVFVRGHDLAGPSRQDLLIQRYRTLPPNVR
jgi:imidazolonepropionase-like amidohydrolase